MDAVFLFFMLGFGFLVIPYNPSSHESLDQVGEEKEVSSLVLFCIMPLVLYWDLKM